MTIQEVGARDEPELATSIAELGERIAALQVAIAGIQEVAELMVEAASDL